MHTLILATEGLGPVATLGAAHHAAALATVLYVVGFACQVLGGVIVLLGLVDDARTAKRLPTGGATWEWIGRVPDAVRGRLAARRGWRIAGVVLIFVGAGVGLAANLLALGRT